MNSNNNFFSSDNIIAWIVAIVCLCAFWPLGLFLIFKLLASPATKKQAARARDTFEQYRQESTARQYQYSYVNTAPKEKSAAKSNKSKKKKEIPASGATLFLILAIVFFIIGFANITDFFDYQELTSLLSALFFTAGGAVSLFARSRAKRKARRLTKYLTVMGFDDAKSVSEIADATGYSETTVRKDLNYLAERGYFGDAAYFDIGLDSIVISSEAAESERQRRYAEEQSQAAARHAEADPYMSVLSEFRRLHNSITDPEISAKVGELEELTAKIFKAVENDPDKQAEIRKFMDYYLPATNKLLKSYTTLEKQGISGKNINSTKQDIERILDSLIEGYRRQLDRLFGSDALDISSDIDVLETMLKQDGLSSDGDMFSQGSH